MQLRVFFATLALCAAAAPAKDFINVVPQTPAIGFGGPPPDGCTLGVTGGFCAGANLSCVPAGSKTYTHRMCDATYIDELDVGQMPALAQLYADIAALADRLATVKGELMICPAGMQPTDLYRCEACPEGTYSGAHDAQPCLPVTAVTMCAAYSAVADACIECAPGSTLDEQSNTCTAPACPPGTGQGGDCDTACYTGYYNDGTYAACQPIAPLPHCTAYSITTGACTTCGDGMLLAGGVCVGCPYEVYPFVQLPDLGATTMVYSFTDGGVTVQLSVRTDVSQLALEITDGASVASETVLYANGACDGHAVVIPVHIATGTYESCTFVMDRPSVLQCVCGANGRYTSSSGGIACTSLSCDPGYGANGDCAVACASGTYNDGTANECAPSTPVPNCATYSTVADQCEACYMLYEISGTHTCVPWNAPYDIHALTYHVPHDMSVDTGVFYLHYTSGAEGDGTYVTLFKNDRYRSAYRENYHGHDTTYDLVHTYPLCQSDRLVYLAQHATANSLEMPICHVLYEYCADGIVRVLCGTCAPGYGLSTAVEGPTYLRSLCDKCVVSSLAAEATYSATGSTECQPCAAVDKIRDCRVGVMGGVDCTCR